MSLELTLNRALIIRIMNEIKAEPVLFNIRKWVVPTSMLQENPFSVDDPGETSYAQRARILRESNICGTICCVAGHAIRLELNGVFVRLQNGTDTLHYTWKGTAGRLLGLTSNQASCLFHLAYWPREWKTRYEAAKGDPYQESQCAVDFLQAILDSNGQILNKC